MATLLIMIPRTYPFILGFLLVLALGASAQNREEGQFNFRIEIDGISAGAFRNVEGLSMELEVIEYQDGDDLLLRKRPGRAKFGNIVLKRGYINNTSLQQWFHEIRQGRLAKRNISIFLDDRLGNQVQRWNLSGCWPKQWKLSGFDDDGNALVSEEITIVVEEVLLGN